MKPSILGIILIISSLIIPLPTLSQPICDRDGDYEEKSETYRTVELKDWGITVDIPSNYRTMKRQDGSVQILHPDDYQMIQCLANGGIGGGGYYSENLSLVEDDLTMNLKEQAMWSVGYGTDNNGNRQPNFQEIIDYNHNGVKGYIVTSFSGYGVVFLGTIPGQTKLLEVSASCDCPVELEDVTDLLGRIKLLSN